MNLLQQITELRAQVQNNVLGVGQRVELQMAIHGIEEKIKEIKSHAEEPPTGHTCAPSTNHRLRNIRKIIYGVS